MNRHPLPVSALPVAAIALAAILLIGGPAHAANLLTNGDFEDTSGGWTTTSAGTSTTPAGWTTSPGRVNAANTQSGANAIGGSGTSAYLPDFPSSTESTRRDLLQNVTGGQSVWTFDMDFATQDPGGPTDRSLTLGLRDNEVNFNNINIRLVDIDSDGDGDLQAFDFVGNAFQTVLTNAVVFDPDVTTTPLVHHIQIVGHWSTASRVYDIYVTDSNGVTRSVTDLAFYQVGTPNMGNTIAGVLFTTFLSSSDYLIDNISLINGLPPVVTIPAPAALPAGLSLLGLLAKRSRRR